MSMTSVVISSLISSALVTLALALVLRLLSTRRSSSAGLDARIVALAAQLLASGPAHGTAIYDEIGSLLAQARNRPLTAEQRRLLEWLRERAAAGEPEWQLGDVSEPVLPMPAARADAPRSAPGFALVPAGESDRPDSATSGARPSAEVQAQVGALSTALCFDADPDQRASAAIELGRLGDPSGVPHLVTALRSDSTERVRTLSAVALGMIGSRDAISPLIDVIQRQIRDRIEVSSDITYGGFQLIRTLQREIDPEPTAWLGQDPVAAQIWALGRIASPQACAALCERLTDSDPGIRWFAAWALGKIGDESTVPALAALLGDRSVEVRWIAIWSLGRMNSTRAVPSLIERANDPDATIRRIAVWALGRSGDLRAREIVLRALTDPERGVRQVASWALSQIDTEIRAIA
jgi:hypothetical protein